MINKIKKEADKDILTNKKINIPPLETKEI